MFSLEGSYRCELLEKYYPELFERMRELVLTGRRNVSGSSYENGDVNIPSPEALFRNILYGNGYLKKTFGKTSRDIYLPDCFGYALPQDNNIVLLAACALGHERETVPACDMYDSLEKREIDFELTREQQKASRTTWTRRFRYRTKFLLGFVRRRIRREIAQLF